MRNNPLQRFIERPYCPLCGNEMVQVTLEFSGDQIVGWACECQNPTRTRDIVLAKGLPGLGVTYTLGERT